MSEASFDNALSLLPKLPAVAIDHGQQAIEGYSE
jgi:hypothetical protein